MKVKEKNEYILLSSFQAISQVIPLPSNTEPILEKESPIQIKDMGVMIGVHGDIKGQILFNGSKETFSSLGETLFGMSIGADMLPSFIGELGNMVAGNISTIVSTKSIFIDITPPTVLEGNQKHVSDFDKVLTSKMNLADKGSLSIAFMYN